MILYGKNESCRDVRMDMAGLDINAELISRWQTYSKAAYVMYQGK